MVWGALRPQRYINGRSKMLTKYATQRCLPPIAFGPLRYRPIPHVFIINVFRLFVDNFYGKARFGIYYCG